MCCLWDNVEKYGGDRAATNDVTLWRIRVACWISKATCTHAHAHAQPLGHKHTCARAHTDKYVILIAFPRQQQFAKAPQCYVICTRWFKYDRDKLRVVYTQIVPVISEPPCTLSAAVSYPASQTKLTRKNQNDIPTCSFWAFSLVRYFLEGHTFQKPDLFRDPPTQKAP